MMDFFFHVSLMFNFVSGHPSLITQIIRHKENVKNHNYASTISSSFSFCHIGSSSTPLFSHHPIRHFNDVTPWLRRRSSDFVSVISGHPSHLNPPPRGHYPVPLTASLSPVIPQRLPCSLSLPLSLMTYLLTSNPFTSICPSAHTHQHTSPLSKFPCGPWLHVPGCSTPPMERPTSDRSSWGGNSRTGAHERGI